MNKKDKRSRKTARAVQNALLRLLCERRIDEIKIVDLCTAADINRTTFYLHYARIGDVLDELRDEQCKRNDRNQREGALQPLQASNCPTRAPSAHT